MEAGEGAPGAWVACGVGVNVAHTPPDAGQAAISLAELRGDPSVTADLALESLRERFAARLAEARRGFDAVLDAWLARADGLGETVAVSVGEARIEGVLEGLESDGALRLRLPGGETRVIRAGDVSLVKER